MEDPRKLRELAGWYREFAERADNPTIWHVRLMTVEDLPNMASLTPWHKNPPRGGRYSGDAGLCCRALRRRRSMGGGGRAGRAGATPADR